MFYAGLSREVMFPVLTNDALMRQMTSASEAVKWREQPNGAIVVNVQKGMPCEYSNEFEREARGLVFKDGKVVCRPLHKFFNVNERPSTLAESIDWSRVASVMLKHDGSMINVVNVYDAGRPWSLKSKAAFGTDVVKYTYAWLQENDERYERYSNLFHYCVQNDLTAVLEWMSPTSRIVVGYTVSNLELLHVRHNQTGRYHTRDEVQELAERFAAPFVYEDEQATKLLQEGGMSALIDYAQVIEGIEGWVIQFDDGDMVKLKTKWYMDRHHAMTFLRRRDIAKMVIAEALDDLKAKLVGDGIDVTPILEIEKQVKETLELVTQQVESLYETFKHLPRREFYEAINKQPIVRLTMDRYSGKEPRVVEHFAKHMLDEMFDLEQINLVDSIADAEEDE